MSKSPLLDQVREVLRLRHYSIRTEEAYVQTIRRFILYHRKRHPREMGVDEIRQYLSHLATDGNVAASTQNVALCALLFLYRQVLAIDLPLIENVERAKGPKRVPVVFTPGEVRRVLANIHGTHLMMASLLYGAGLRLMECAASNYTALPSRPRSSFTAYCCMCCRAAVPRSGITVSGVPCSKQLEQARTLLSTSTTTNAVDSAPDTPPTEQALQSTPARCPLCGIGQLLLVQVLPPQRKVPP